MTDALALHEIGSGIHRNAAETHALAERVDYLFVAVMRGDPRFCRAEHAVGDFDASAFDRAWAARGKRVPPPAEIF